MGVHPRGGFASVYIVISRNDENVIHTTAGSGTEQILQPVSCELVFVLRTRKGDVAGNKDRVSWATNIRPHFPDVVNDVATKRTVRIVVPADFLGPKMNV